MPVRKGHVSSRMPNASKTAIVSLILRYDLLNRIELRDAFHSAFLGKENKQSATKLVQKSWEVVLCLSKAYLTGTPTVVTDICVMSVLSESTVKRQLRKLVSQGIVDKFPDENDQRRQFVILKQPYLEVLDSFVKECDEEFKELIEHHDLREREKAQKALRDSERRFRDYAEMSADWFWEMDEELRFTKFSDGLFKTTGLDKKIFIGKTIRELVFDKYRDKPHIKNHLEDLDAHREFENFTHYYNTPEGKELYSRNSGRPLFNDQGKFIGYRGTSSDVTKRKRLEQELREARDGLERKVEERTHSLAEAQRISHVGNWNWDIINGTLWWSEEIYRIFDLDPGSFEPKYEAFLEAIHPDDRKNVASTVDKALKEEFPYNIEHRIILPDGGVKYVHEIAEVSFDDDGSPVNMIGTVQDITKAKHAQIDLAVSKQMMTNLVENTQEGFWTIDTDGLTTDANPAMCNILGRDREDILGFSIFDFVDEENAEIFRQQIEKRKTGKKGTYEVALQRRDGTNIPCINSATPVFNLQGEETGSVGLFTEISAIKEAKSALENSEERFRDFAESASDWFWETGPDHRFTYFSSLFEKTLGIDPKTILGRSREELIPAGLGSAEQEMWWRHLDDLNHHRPFKNFQYKSDFLNSQKRVIRVNGVPYHDKDGTFLGYRGTGIDVTQEIEAANELRESEARFRELYDSLPIGVVLKTSNGEITVSNPAAQSILQLSEDQIREDQLHNRTSEGPDWIAIHEDGRPFPGTEHPSMQCLATGQPQRDVVMGLQYPDMTVWISINSQPLFKENDAQPYAVISSFNDITEAKRAEESLRAAEKEYREVFENALQGIVITTPEGKIERVNPAFAEMLGYTSPEELKKHITNIGEQIWVDPKERTAMLEKLMREDKAHTEAQFRCRDGKTTWVSMAVWGKYDKDGKLVTIEAFLEDITKRRQVEEELQKAHDELELRIVERTHALIEEIQERRTIEAELLDKTELQQLLYTVAAIANEADNTDTAMTACLKEICDYTTWPVGHIYVISPSNSDKFIPTDIWHMEDPKWFSVFHDITMKTVFDRGIGMVGRVMDSGKPEWIKDVTGNPEFIRAIPGMDIVVKACFGFPIKVRNKVVAVMEFFSPFDQKEDQLLMQSIEHIGLQLGHLHERAEAERTLLEAMKEAETANKIKSDFLSSMSHELRTPLNAIIGFSGIMKDEAFGPIENDKYREYQNDIHHSGHHLLKLINDVLDVSAIEAGALELQEENVNLTDVVDVSVHMIGPRADDGQVTVTSSIDSEIPLIYADERRIKQVILNLLSNAVKFTPEGGEVSISALLNEEGSLAVVVADTGMGMDEEEIRTALSRFGQVDSGLNRKHEGTGLGLPLTRGLMEQHGGTLDVKSEKTHGTMVTVTFPKERVIQNVC